MSVQRSEMCRYWSLVAFCPFGDVCKFAHGKLNLVNVPKHKFYKTKQCAKFWSLGYCVYGSRCMFAHLKKKINVTYSMLLLCFRPSSRTTSRLATWKQPEIVGLPIKAAMKGKMGKAAMKVNHIVSI